MKKVLSQQGKLRHWSTWGNQRVERYSSCSKLQCLSIRRVTAVSIFLQKIVRADKRPDTHFPRGVKGFWGVSEPCKFEIWASSCVLHDPLRVGCSDSLPKTSGGGKTIAKNGTRAVTYRCQTYQCPPSLHIFGEHASI